MTGVFRTAADAPGKPFRSAAPVGLLWLGLAATGLAVQDLERMRRWAATPSEHELLLIGAGVLSLAVAVGFVIHYLGHVLETGWLAAYGRLGGPLIARRRRRWRRAADDADRAREADDTAAFQRASQRRNRICLTEPSRPTWMGDRVAALEARVRGEYGLDLASVWPRLWLVLSPEVRGECHRARLAWQRFKIVSGWGLLFLLVGRWWWPALMVGVGVYVIGWSRARTAIDALSTLVEVVVDLHASDLLVDRAGPVLEPEQGRLLTTRFRKGT